MNLPTQNYRAAEYLGLRSGYSVYRQTSPDRKSPKASKRKYDCPIFENESPIQPFSSLPHPNDLFGKRSKKEGKKKRIQVNPVNYHSQQLHQKQAKLNMTTNEQQGDSVNDSRIHGRTLHKAYTDSLSRLDSSAQNSSTTDDRKDSSKSFVSSDNAHSNLKRTMQYENIKSLDHFPFSFKTTSKIYEE
ncbi:uncharacterized protein LOC132759831 isoform X2 [Ruditapes philippinarum]|nr:uncharacterized protein LOC132759831 isoform X2 [Ruditapes philippinarum]